MSWTESDFLGVLPFSYEPPTYIYNKVNMNEDEISLPNGYGEDGSLVEDMLQRCERRDDDYRSSETAYMPTKFSEKAKNGLANKWKNKKDKKQKSFKVDWPEIIGYLVLVHVGDSPFLYEAIIREVSMHSRAVYLERSPRKDAKTISVKMEGWWRSDMVSFVDQIRKRESGGMIRKVL